MPEFLCLVKLMEDNHCNITNQKH